MPNLFSNDLRTNFSLQRLSLVPQQGKKNKTHLAAFDPNTEALPMPLRAGGADDSLPDDVEIIAVPETPLIVIPVTKLDALISVASSRASS